MAKRMLFAYALSDKNPLVYAGALHALPYTLFFDSADRSNALSRYSFIAFQPVETIESKNGRITVANPDQHLSLIGDPFRIVQQRLDLWCGDWRSNDDLPPFQGGAAGCFGYDLARQLERLPTIAREDSPVPDMMIGIYDQILAFDHKRNKAWFLTQAETEAQAKTRLADLHAVIEKAEPVSPSVPEVSFLPDLSPGDYKKRLGKVIDYVYAGDIFQANLSQRFSARLPHGFNSFSHYLHLRRVNAAPFAAYMNFGTVRLASASPERFLRVFEQQVETRPIKGTRLRPIDPMANPELDAKAARDLQRSEKDRAENAMIVDLLRNDLSKVCMDHSIDVPVLCELESFARVHHLVSVIKGTLRADRTPLELLRACFPGGSVTGAPKVRAMEIIEQLEPARRGPYCGALGYVGVGGAMDTSIVIRTLVYNGMDASFNVGGGIVADSSAESEYQETLDKAEGLLRSFKAAEPQFHTPRNCAHS